jgi:phosphoribosylformylglycinamidine (FGAM) synthase-like enzyme
LAEMALAGRIGAKIDATPNMVPHAWYFGEDQARYLCITNTPEALLSKAQNAGVAAAVIGRTGGNTLILPDGVTICLDSLRDAHEGWLPRYMAMA